MEKTISFKEWATKWWQENDKTKSKVTKNDVDELGRRLRKAIDAVFGFENHEKVNEMYDDVELNDIYPDMVAPLVLEDEQQNLSVLAEVERMPKEERPNYTGKKIDRIKALKKEKKEAAVRCNVLAKKPDNDQIALERKTKINDKIERIEKDIENLKTKLVKCPLGKTPILEVVGETEGRLYDFFLKKIGRGGSVTPYSYADIQNGYWEKVDIDDRCELYELVKELCEKEEWHIAFGFGNYLNTQFDLYKFSQKIFMPQIYRCKEKADMLSKYLGDMTAIEMFEGNDEFLSKLDRFNGIEKRLDILLEETESIHTPFMDKYIELWSSGVLVGGDGEK